GLSRGHSLASGLGGPSAEKPARPSSISVTACEQWPKSNEPRTSVIRISSRRWISLRPSWPKSSRATAHEHRTLPLVVARDPEPNAAARAPAMRFGHDRCALRVPRDGTIPPGGTVVASVGAPERGALALDCANRR